MSKRKNNKHLIVGIIFLAAGILGIIPLLLITDNASFLTILNRKSPYTPITKEIKLVAKTAYLYDVGAEKELYAKNPEVILPLASITKIMAAFAASQLLDPGTIITLDAEDLLLPENHGLILGEKWKLENLLPFALAVSSNDAFNAIGKEVEKRRGIPLVTAMNLKAQELGLTHTIFYNETGLDMPNGKNGGYSTCEDVVHLLSYAYRDKRELFAKTAQDSFIVYAESGMGHKAINTDILAAKIPWLRAGKTGLTPLVGGSLAVLLEPQKGHLVAACVLGSTEVGRFNDIETLITTLISQTS